MLKCRMCQGEGYESLACLSPILSVNILESFSPQPRELMKWSALVVEIQDNIDKELRNR